MSLLKQQQYERLTQQRDRINELAQNWCLAGSDDQAVRSNLLAELAQILLDIGPESEGPRYEYGATYRDLYQTSVSFAITSLIEGHFDPQAGQFCPYFYGICNKILLKNRGSSRHQKGTWINENGEEKRNYETNVSLQQELNPNSGSEAYTLESIQSVGSADSLDASLLAQERLFAILPVAIDTWNKLLSGSATKRRSGTVLRMVYTDFMVEKILDTNAGNVYLPRERQLFQSMDLDFLDFFMLRQCRTISVLVSSGLKLYGVLVPGEKMEECPLPLPLPVYNKYMKDSLGINRDTSGISKRRAQLKNMIESIQADSRKSPC